jgi:hypothetical protein
MLSKKYIKQKALAKRALPYAESGDLKCLTDYLSDFCEIPDENEVFVLMCLVSMNNKDFGLLYCEESKKWTVRKSIPVIGKLVSNKGVAIADASTPQWLDYLLDQKQEVIDVSFATYAQYSQLRYAAMTGRITINHYESGDSQYKSDSSGSAVSTKLDMFMPTGIRQVEALMRGPDKEPDFGPETKKLTFRVSTENVDAIADEEVHQWCLDILSGPEKDIPVATAAQFNQIRVAVRMGELMPTTIGLNNRLILIGNKGEYNNPEKDLMESSYKVTQNQIAFNCLIDKIKKELENS